MSLLSHLTTKTLDLLLPPLCLACDKPVSTDKTLCPDCWSQIHFIASPFCACCGAPFETPVGDGMTCGACITEPPTFKAARAAMLYNDASKPIILSFKHGDRTHTASALAAWMHRAASELWPQTDIIMPVPLHRWRLFHRRYNQSALLAHHLGKLAQKPVLIHALRRTRATPPQGHNNRKDRFKNVKNAFALNPAHAIQGKTILLIDDVLTTGATVQECACLLLENKAAAVQVLTLARAKQSV